ncbi:MAG: DUF5996 family protein [Pseudomonadota bacterium]|nr:DUF5996 family protein [Pseudomonadota bacterium]
MVASHHSGSDAWPSLAFLDWKDTCATLHLWTQIVGKIRLVQSPWVNHSWHCALYLTARGLTTSPIPYGTRTFQMDFDFCDHQLLLTTSDGGVRTLSLAPRSVADFYRELFEKLVELDIRVTIHTTPNEIPNAIAFEQDQVHAAYDPEYANRFWRVLVQADRIIKRFRADFIGKCSPVHFFWGSFDLACSRFSGRRAPPHPGGVPNFPDWVAREAYSHEVSSCGFWPGNEQVPEALFYAYAYPAPEGFSEAPVQPDAARFDASLGEFVLPYEVVRQAPEPERLLLDFLRSTYEAAAERGHWNRAELEGPPVVGR